jgi:hypothetical protein
MRRLGAEWIRRRDVPGRSAGRRVPTGLSDDASMSILDPAIAKDLAPTGTLRAAINLGNPVLASGTPAARAA